jgi:hypothetical protein
MNKYDTIYKEFKEFCIRIKISSHNLLKGDTEENIKFFESEYDISLPIGFRIGLKYFGCQTSFYNGISLDIKNNLTRIRKAIKVNKDRQFLKNVHLLDSGLQNILPIDYYVESSVMSFIKLDEENPQIWAYFGDSDDGNLDEDDLDSDGTWINILRKAVFNQLQHKFYFIINPINDPDPNEISGELYIRGLNIDTKKIPWSNIYIEAYRKGMGVNWDWYREEFEEIATEIENREERILGIDEFEWMFIDYLREKGEL